MEQTLKRNCCFCVTVKLWDSGQYAEMELRGQWKQEATSSQGKLASADLSHTLSKAHL